jgi:hypothetical protein
LEKDFNDYNSFTPGEQAILIFPQNKLQFRKLKASKLPVAELNVARFPQAVATLIWGEGLRMGFRG